jgi:CubicO group peptidase (beta-lactamase class C family)
LRRLNGAFGTRQILPERWVTACCGGDRAAYVRKGYTSVFPKGSYARKWWIADADRRIRLALGVHGQMIYLDPLNELACVKTDGSVGPAFRMCTAIRHGRHIHWEALAVLEQGLVKPH